ncbi:MAG: alpha/beta hydrolase [Ilumatobacteraceae bacterium]
MRWSWDPPRPAEDFVAMRARVVGPGDGTGRGAIVLVHGLLASNRYWDGHYDALATEGRRVVVPDLSGFGPALRPAPSYGYRTQSECLLALLDELDVHRPVVIGAHSFGCLVALQAAAARPDLVGGIVAFSPPLYSDRASAKSHIRHSGKMARLGLADGPIAQAVCNWHCRHRDLARKLVPFIKPTLPRVVAADSAWHTWESFRGALDSMLTTNGNELVGGVVCPVDFVAGRDDATMEAGALDAIGRMPERTLSWVAGGDHHLPMKHRELCIERLDSMWRLADTR